MRILSWLKSKLSGGPSTGELRKIPLMNEKWICPKFEFPFPDSKFIQLRKPHILRPGEKPTREEVVMGWVLPYLGEMGEVKRLACLVNEETFPPTVRLRFPDRTKGDEELFSGGRILQVLPTSEDECRLSPIELIEYGECFGCIEEILLTIFGLKKLQKGTLVKFYFEGLNMKEEPTEKEMRKKRLMVERTDDVSYFNYPLEKRVELFSKHEEAEKWLSKKLFGESFKDFIDFIMEREETDKHMKIYCSKARKLLEKYDIY